MTFFTACSPRSAPNPATSFPPASSPAPAPEPASSPAPEPVVWVLENSGGIGGVVPAVLGRAPRAEMVGGRRALRFDGAGEALLLPATPFAAWAKFTIEVDVFPEAGGAFEQRFLHAGTVRGPRAMMELRSNPDGSWYLDTYLQGGAESASGLTLKDESGTFPPGRWYTVALAYDGETMSQYVDGVKQGEGRVFFPPLGPCELSLGARQNKVSWFKGALGEVRFWPGARK